MNPKQIMFMGLVLAAGTLVSLTFGGAWFDSTDLDVTNSLTVFKQANILSTWSVMVPNVSFFITGAKALTTFDFAFFNGGMQIVQWFLCMTLGLGFIWGVMTVMIYVIQGLFGRR